MPATEDRNEIGPLGEALLRLARGTVQDLASLLHNVEVHSNIENTRVIFHCHSVRIDGNGRPRVADLVAAIADYILDFAVPRSAIQEARETFISTNSSAALMRLRQQAAALFTDLTNTGEGGELLLFVLAETVLRLPQILCKMGLKTNSRMHVHGADGLHAGVDSESGHLLLYWGESKLHAGAVDAIRECFGSIAPMLKSSGESGQAERDMQLLGRHADLANDELTAAIKTYLDPRHEHFNRLEFCGLCLVGFDSMAYPAATEQAQHDAVLQAIAIELPTWKRAIERRLGVEELSTFAFHVICVPFPSVEDFRTKLLTHLGLV